MDVVKGRGVCVEWGVGVEWGEWGVEDECAKGCGVYECK